MNCPTCRQPLRLDRNDENNNPNTGVKYDRKIYVCDKDDLWLTIEAPK
ncbi:MAG: hypothetical protein U0524_03270 [Candidatus Saccharimonadales bacterium]